MVVEAISPDGWKPDTIPGGPSFFGCKPVDSFESGVSKAKTAENRDSMVLDAMIDSMVLDTMIR